MLKVGTEDPYYIVFMSIFPFSFVNICFKYLVDPFLSASVSTVSWTFVKLMLLPLYSDLLYLLELIFTDGPFYLI